MKKASGISKKAPGIHDWKLWIPNIDLLIIVMWLRQVWTETVISIAPPSLMSKSLSLRSNSQPRQLRSKCISNAIRPELSWPRVTLKRQKFTKSMQWERIGKKSIERSRFQEKHTHFLSKIFSVAYLVPGTLLQCPQCFCTICGLWRTLYLFSMQFASAIRFTY